MRTIAIIGLTLTMLGSPSYGQALRCPIGFHRNLLGRCVPHFITGIRRYGHRPHAPMYPVPHGGHHR